LADLTKDSQKGKLLNLGGFMSQDYARPLPGQRGFPGVAPDVPGDDLDEAFSTGGGDLDGAFGPHGEHGVVIADDERSVFVVIVDHVKREEVSEKIMELAQSLGGELYVIQTTTGE
jgi:hypothetical protein